MRPLLGQPTPKPEERGAALLLSFLFFAIGPFFGFASTVPTRFARHI